MNDITIDVGILTDGHPEVKGDRVVNALMGKGFHWQHTYCLFLPSEAQIICEGEDFLKVRLPLEGYLASVVGSEMNPNAPAEFLKAHAIISRSWVVGKILGLDAAGGEMLQSSAEIRIWDDTAAHSDFHVCNDDHCQRFQGLQSVPETVMTQLQATRGLILVNEANRPVDARFSKCCGGITEVFSTCWQDIDYPYLTSRADEWCDPEILTASEKKLLHECLLKDYDSDTSYYEWTSEISGGAIADNLHRLHNRNIGRVTALEPLDRGPSGRIHRLRVIGSDGEVIVGKELAIRKLLSSTHLLSSAFDVEKKEGLPEFKLHGKGWGHGVGLCQIGAAVMALKGFSAEHILKYYYPGTHIADLAVCDKLTLPE